MAYLKEKSEFNKDAAELLYNKTLFAPSIHCAYYSCFQLLKYIVKEYFKIDYSQQDIEIGSDPKNNPHTYVANKVMNEIRNKDKQNYSRIKRMLGDLKQARIASDYKDRQIDTDKSKKAVDNAKELRTYFINHLL